MNVRFDMLFKIECRHNYFADSLYSSLKLSPTEACKRLLQRYDLLFREMPGGGAVYYGKRNDLTIIRTIREIIPFTFTLTSTDPHLINYTDLALYDGALSPSDSVFYFSNLVEHSRTLHGKSRRLIHSRNQVDVRDQLRVEPSAFRYPFKPSVQDVLLQVVDGLRGEEVWRARTGPQAISGYPIDLRGQPPGRYRLLVEGKAKHTFYRTDTLPSKLWGLVEIYVSDSRSASPASLPKGARPLVIEPKEKITSRTYSLYFETRETHWKYYIVNQFGVNTRFDGYQVVHKVKNGAKRRRGAKASPFKDVPFRKVKEVEVNGKQALIFESNEAIPLWDLPAEEHDFKFEPGGGASKNGRTFKLPYAGSTAIKPVPSRPKKIFSEIYAYL